MIYVNATDEGQLPETGYYSAILGMRPLTSALGRDKWACS